MLREHLGKGRLPIFRYKNLPNNRNFYWRQSILNFLRKALEEKVSELEAENNCLRQALSLPPSRRPPLGRGPTGKDRPRKFRDSILQSLSPQPSHESSADLSPTSFPTSQSLTYMADSMSSRCAAAAVPSAWNESMSLNNQSHQTLQHSDLIEPSHSPHRLSAIPAWAVSMKQYASYVNPVPSSSREFPCVYQSLNVLNDHTQSPDRPTSISRNYSNQNFSSLVACAGEIREEIHQEYVYTHAYYQHDLNMRSQSPSPTSQLHPHVNSLQHDSTTPFSHRRSSLNPQGFSIGQGFTHLPNSAQLQNNPLPDHPHEPNHLHMSTNPRPARYEKDEQFNPVL